MKAPEQLTYYNDLDTNVQRVKELEQFVGKYVGIVCGSNVGIIGFARGVVKSKKDWFTNQMECKPEYLEVTCGRGRVVAVYDAFEL